MSHRGLLLIISCIERNVMAVSKFDRFIKMLNTGLLTLAIFMIEKVIVRLDTINTAINKQEEKNKGYDASLQSQSATLQSVITKQQLQEKQTTFLFAHFKLPLIQN